MLCLQRCIMIDETKARQLLIDSCHSSAEAEHCISQELNSAEFIGVLVRIAVDADDYQGDAPGAAAHFLSQAEPTLVKPYEYPLVALLESADGYAGSIALILGRMRSAGAKAVIEHRIAEGWPEHLYKQALSFYE